MELCNGRCRQIGTSVSSTRLPAVPLLLLTGSLQNHLQQMLTFWVVLWFAPVKIKPPQGTPSWGSPVFEPSAVMFGVPQSRAKGKPRLSDVHGRFPKRQVVFRNPAVSLHVLKNILLYPLLVLNGPLEVFFVIFSRGRKVNGSLSLHD